MAYKSDQKLGDADIDIFDMHNAIQRVLLESPSAFKAHYVDSLLRTKQAFEESYDLKYLANFNPNSPERTLSRADQLLISAVFWRDAVQGFRPYDEFISASISGDDIYREEAHTDETLDSCASVFVHRESSLLTHLALVRGIPVFAFLTAKEPLDGVYEIKVSATPAIYMLNNILGKYLFDRRYTLPCVDYAFALNTTEGIALPSTRTVCEETIAYYAQSGMGSLYGATKDGLIDMLVKSGYDKTAQSFKDTLSLEAELYEAHAESSMF